jgi:hypothetical protein
MERCSCPTFPERTGVTGRRTSQPYMCDVDMSAKVYCRLLVIDSSMPRARLLVWQARCLLRIQMSTNLLTWAQLRGFCPEKLVHWVPPGRDTCAEGRCLYLLPAVSRQLSARPWPDSRGESVQRTSQRRGAMFAVMEAFVDGARLVLNGDIKELGSEDPLRPNMRGYWALRSQGLRTQTRLLGFFARPGAFVATDFGSRDRLNLPNGWPNSRRVSTTRWNALTGRAAYLDSPWPVSSTEKLSIYLDRCDNDE